MSKVKWQIWVLIVLGGCVSNHPLEWRELAAVPDAQGFAGAFAGVSGDALIVAGGANFPGKMPWEGGTKVYYDKVFVLETPDGRWRETSWLEQKLGYGVSVTTSDSMVCIGGCDSSSCYPTVLQLIWRDGQLYPFYRRELPIPLANACGAYVGDRIVVAGGEERLGATQSSARVFSFAISPLNIADPQWRELPPLPGNGRTLAFAANLEGKFCIFGGVELSADASGKPVRRYLNDAYRLGENGWERLADMPFPLAAGPTPAPVNERGEVFLMGGDDGSKVGFSPLEKHPGFRDDVLIYNARDNQWRVGGKVPAPRATLTAVRWRGGIVLPSGEMRPGVRSPKVWWMNFQ